MVNIYHSKYTKGISAKDCWFPKGEKVWYRMRNGEEFLITIDCNEKMENSGYIGYESIFPDDGCRYFAVEDGIYDWDGKN